jgi:aspartokinase-like uncharacterized kinase
VIVVKVGGSLFDHPALGPGLRDFVGALDGDVLLVAGGGGVADAVRHLDRVHGLGEERAHRLALRSLAVTAELLKALRFASRLNVLDCERFALDDPTLPHTWGVTTDSIAARAAAVYGASRLVLLKSLDIPAGTPWDVAAANGWVDAHFPRAVTGAAFAVEVVNFRARLDARSPG